MMGFGPPGFAPNGGMPPGMYPGMAPGMAPPGMGMQFGGAPPVHSGRKPHYAPAPMEPTGEKMDKPDVFISLRFNEAGREGDLLQEELGRHNIKAYIDRSSSGQDIHAAIAHAIVNCRLAVILGTKTYGRQTGGVFDTKKELDYILGNKKDFVLIKMCDRFEEATTAFQFSGNTIGYIQWMPGHPLPSTIIPTIKARLQGVPPQPQPAQAPPAPAPPAPVAQASCTSCRKKFELSGHYTVVQPLCPTCRANQHGSTSASSGHVSQVRKYCPAGHELTNCGRRRGWRCDNPEGCSRGGSGSDDWQCRECDFDLCGVCYAQVKPGERAPGPAEERAPESEDDDSDDGLENLLNALKAMEHAPTDNADTTWPGEIQRRSCVRVVAPQGLGATVKVGDIGIVKDRRDADGSYIVNFHGNSNWRAGSQDIVLDHTAEKIQKGTRVRIKPSVKSLTYSGTPEHDRGGFVRKIDYENCKVEVEQGRERPWVFDISELEPVAGNFGNWSGKIQCGNAVKVKAGVETPKKKWGSVRPGDVGIARKLFFTPDKGEEIIIIDFPKCDDWRGVPAEIEVDAVADRVRPGVKVQVKKTVSEPNRGWQGVTHMSTGVVKSVGYDGRVVVKFDEQEEFKSELRELVPVGTGGAGKACCVIA